MTSVMASNAANIATASAAAHHVNTSDEIEAPDFNRSERKAEKSHRKLAFIIAICAAAVLAAGVGTAFALNAGHNNNKTVKAPAKTTKVASALAPQKSIDAAEQARETSATAAIALCADPAKATKATFADAQTLIAKCTDTVFKANATSQLAAYGVTYSKYVASATTATPAQKAEASAVASTTNKAASTASKVVASSPKKSGSSTSAAKVWVPPVYRTVNVAAVYKTVDVAAVYTTVQVPAVYQNETVTVPAVTTTVPYWETSDGQTFDSQAEVTAYIGQHLGEPISETVKYKTVVTTPATTKTESVLVTPATTKQVLVTPATTKQVLVSAAYTTQVLVSAGYWK